MSTLSPDLWQRACERLALDLPEQQFTTWIRPLSAGVTVTDGVAEAGEPGPITVSVRVPNRFKLDWIRAQYAHRLEAALSEVAAGPVKLELSVAPQRSEAPAMPLRRTQPLAAATLAIDALIALHKRPDAVPEGVIPYGLPRLMEEVGRLHAWYLPLVGAPPLSAAAITSYGRIWEEVLPLAWKAPTSLILFDYHVDNLMLVPGRTGIKACGMLDFQDAVSGPITYDLMSLLEDARRDVDPALVTDLKQRYLAAFPALNPENFGTSWAVMAAQRHMRVIGTFARLKLRDNKPHYLVHMPRLWRYMDRCLAHPVLAPLKAWLDAHVPQAQRRVAA